jgi:small subunit ribosomal protein S18
VRSRSGRFGEGQERHSGPGTRRRRTEAPRRRQPPIKLEDIDWKDARTLRPFLDDAGRIRPRRKIGASVKMQRAIARAVKRARLRGAAALHSRAQQNDRRGGLIDDLTTQLA